MKRYLYIAFGLAALFGIYYAYNSNKIEQQNTDTDTVTAEQNTSTKVEEVTATDTSDKKDAAPTNELAKKELFSDTPSGRSMNKIMTLYTDLDAPDSPKGKEAHAELQKLFDAPNQAFEEIKKSVLALPHDKEMPKQFFLQFSSLLNVDRTEKLGFLDKAFKDTLSDASNSVNFQTRRTPVIVYDTYCRVSEDKGLCGKLLSESMDSAPKDVLIPLLNTYKRMDPDGAKEMAKKAGISSY